MNRTALSAPPARAGLARHSIGILLKALEAGKVLAAAAARVSIGHLAALLVAAAHTGCGGTGEHFPLDPGINWLYEIDVRTMDGEFAKRYPVRTGSPTRFRDEAVYPQVTLAGERTYYARRDDGIWRVARQARASNAPVPYLQPSLVLPATLDGDVEWQGRTVTRVLEHTGPPQETLFQIREVVPMRYRLTVEDSPVEVPAGTFSDCVKVVGEGTVNADVGNYIGRTTIRVETTDWYAPGVGLVRAERTETTTSEAIDFGRMVMELATLTR